MTTPLFLLRCVQLGVSIQELELLSIGMINDMYAESRNVEVVIQMTFCGDKRK